MYWSTKTKNLVLTAAHQDGLKNGFNTSIYVCLLPRNVLWHWYPSFSSLTHHCSPRSSCQWQHQHCLPEYPHSRHQISPASSINLQLLSKYVCHSPSVPKHIVTSWCRNSHQILNNRQQVFTICYQLSHTLRPCQHDCSLNIKDTFMWDSSLNTWISSFLTVAFCQLQQQR